MAPPSSPAFPPRPLVCTPGERPDMVVYLPDAPTEQNAPAKRCGIEDARSAYALAVNDYKLQLSKIAPLKLFSGGDNEEKLYPEQSALRNKLFDLVNTIPNALTTNEAITVRHPFMDIIFHLDGFGVDDFRSAAVFDRVAKSDEVRQFAEHHPNMTFLYAASFSHMTPFLIPLELIDQGKLNSAKIIYTEVKPDAVQRARAYLQFWADPARALFTDLQEQKIKTHPGYEVQFTFKYRDKPITFIFGMNRGGKVYSPDSYIKEADFFIFHDGVYDEIATQFLNKAVRFAGRSGREFMVLRDGLDFWQSDYVQGKFSVDATAFPGYYGCTRQHDIPPHAYVVNGAGQLEITRLRKNLAFPRHHVMTHWGETRETAHLVTYRLR